MVSYGIPGMFGPRRPLILHEIEDCVICGKAARFVVDGKHYCKDHRAEGYKARRGVVE